MKKMILLFAALFIYTAFGQEHTIDSSGYKLQNYYLGLNVENLWLSGNAVDWVTGIADTSTSGATHCSAFAAAACERLDTYILRPPDHSQTLLANAQFDWLQTPEAASDGWVLITSTDEYKIFSIAQDMANQGYIVTAVIKNPDTTASGHIALVMPGQISPDSLNTNGPFVIMAGTDNYNSVSLLIGFSRHIISWPERGIWFYYNKNINSVSTIRSAKTGNWSSADTWVGGVVPGSADNVIVAAGETITVDNSNTACENISFENSASHLSMGSSTCALSVYGDFTLGSSTHQVFSAWPAGAKIRFKGSALVQTLNEWNTAGNSTTFMEMEVDKSAGKVVTGGYSNRFCFGTNMNIINGTFELASTDDIETKNLSNSGTQATITIQSNGTFNMVGGSSYIRRGTYTGDTTTFIGPVTVYGTLNLGTSSTYKINMSSINIQNGGLVNIPLNHSTAAGSINIGTINVNSGGTFKNEISTAFWYTNSVIPITMNINSGGTLNYACSSPQVPQVINNNGTIEYTCTLDTVHVPSKITSYNNLFISGGGTKVLQGNAVVNGQLTLANGNIYTNMYTLQISDTGSISRTSGYIIGNLMKNFPAVGSKVFEIGTANGYSPVTVNATSGTGNVSATVIQGISPNAWGSNMLKRYWTLTGKGFKADLIFQYLSSDITGTESNYISGQWSNSVWNYPNSSVNPTLHQFTVYADTSFTTWTAGESKGTSLTDDSKNGIKPASLVLQNNYPNPFNPDTRIKFEIPIAVNVDLSVYDILGKKVITLEDAFMQPGYYERTFSTSKNGMNLSSGIYFYVLKAGDLEIVKKMVFIK